MVLKIKARLRSYCRLEETRIHDTHMQCGVLDQILGHKKSNSGKKNKMSETQLNPGV